MMRMFGKRKHKSNVGNTDTYIGEGTMIEGNINTNASLRIEGQVIGDITCSGDVTIGETGNVQSVISARNVINAGSIRGAVNASGKLTITSKGSVEGSVNVRSLNVYEGAVFLGSCAMESAERKEVRSNAKQQEREPSRQQGKKEKHADHSEKNGGKAQASA
jgi:cytoskeletal protein CcmA (bactofilin family)